MGSSDQLPVISERSSVISQQSSVISDRERERAHGLVSTSVQDLESSMSHYDDESDLRVLLIGLKICKRRGEKTKVKILMRNIRRLSRTLGLA